MSLYRQCQYHTSNSAVSYGKVLLWRLGAEVIGDLCGDEIFAVSILPVPYIQAKKGDQYGPSLHRKRSQKGNWNLSFARHLRASPCEKRWPAF